MRVAIVANEFFDAEGGRVGGFGWAAREAARALRARGDEVVFLTGELRAHDVGRAPQRHGVRLVPRQSSRLANVLAVRRTRPDVVLSIDFRPNYLPILRALPDKGLVVWVRDPRSSADKRRLATLRLPDGSALSQGVAPVDCRSLGPLVRRRGPRVVLGSPAPALLTDRAASAYDLDQPVLELLPNPLPVDVAPVAEAAEPTVVVLGRLDPIKRPWIVLEVARRLPQVRFSLLGQNHFSGSGAWDPGTLPPNVELAGHVDGAEKARRLGEAWLLVNTSLHEGLPVSFLEACAAGTPIVSGLDPEGLVSRAGIALGVVEGDGLSAVDAYVAAIDRLVTDPVERRRLAEAGRAWVMASHGPAAFLEAFDRLSAAVMRATWRPVRSVR